MVGLTRRKQDPDHQDFNPDDSEWNLILAGLFVCFCFGSAVGIVIAIFATCR